MHNEKTTIEFVEGCYKEMLSIKDTCLKPNKYQVSYLREELNLNSTQKLIFDELIETLLTDTFYTILLGLDGATSLGDKQQSYSIKDENGNILEEGEIESLAYEYFYEQRYERDKGFI